MRRHNVSRTLSLALLVTCLVVLLSLSACSSGGSSESEEQSASSEPTYAVHIDDIEMDLVDAGEVLAHWHARWTVKNSPKELVIIDDDGFETEFEECPESEALPYITDTMWEKTGL